MTPLDEVALARSMLAGEPDGFERFVAHFRWKIVRYSRLQCGGTEDAEEVAQETLLRVFQNLGQLRDPQLLRAWVFRIARNACLTLRRKSVFAPPKELSLEDAMDDAPDEAALPDFTLLAGELHAVIDRLILELPASLRPVVLLRDIEELSTTETAQALDLSEEVVRTRLLRGHRAMRQKLDCYLHNHCLEDQPQPDSRPLADGERSALCAEWRKALVTRVTAPDAARL